MKVPSVGQSPQHELALLVAAFQCKLDRLDDDDRDAVIRLMPRLFGDDDDESQSAIEAIDEILSPPKSTVKRFESPVGSASDIQKWTTYISKKIRDAREKAGMTQQQLAEKAGLPQSHISRLEKGQHSPAAKTLEKLSHALGVSKKYFDPSA